MGLSRFNKKGGVHFDIQTEGMEAKKASEIFKEIGSEPLIMRGIFINKDTGMGESVSVVTTNSIIYFGNSCVETARDIREDPEAVKELNEKGAYFKIEEFISKKFKKAGYKFTFLEDSEIPAEVKEDAAQFKY
jgi:hypothetical protein